MFSLKTLEEKGIYFIVIVASLFFIYSINASVDGGDSATYLVGADSIIQGKGYSNIALPQEHLIQHFPQGYSFFLAGIFFLTGFNLIIAKFVNALLMLIAIILVFEFSKKIFPKKISLFISAAFAFDLGILWYSHRLLSEPIFIVLTLAILLIFEKYFSVKKTFNFQFFIVTIMLLIGFFMRSIGAMFILASVIFLGLKKQFKKAIIIACVALPIIFLWNIYATASFTGAPEPVDSYFKQMLLKEISNPSAGFASPIEIIERGLTGIVSYLSVSIPRTIFSPLNAASFFLGENILFFAAGLLISLVFLIGFFSEIKKFQAMHLFVLFYLILVIFIPYNYQSAVNRILLPVLPLLLIFFAKGLLNISKILYEKKIVFMSKNTLFFLVFGLMIVASVTSDIFYISSVHDRQIDSNYKNMELAAIKLKELSNENSLAYSDFPERIYLLSGAKSLPLHLIKEESFKTKQNEFENVFVLITAYNVSAAQYESSIYKDFSVVFTGPDNATKILKKNN